MKYTTIDDVFCAVLDGDATYSDLVDYVHFREELAFKRGIDTAARLTADKPKDSGYVRTIWKIK